MEAPTCHNMTLILSRYSYSYWLNVLSAVRFPEFESVQTIKLVSSELTFYFISYTVLFLTIHNYFSFFSEAFK